MNSNRTACHGWRQAGLQLVVGGLIVALLVGCVRILEPRQSNITYYLLDGQGATDSIAADTAGLSIGLREPTLASYLDAARIVIRYGPHTIQFSDFHRWGENLDRAINRVVARTLERQPDIRSTEVVPWPHGSSFDYVVQMHILEFEGRSPRPLAEQTKGDEEAPPVGHSQMLAQWSVLSADGETVLARGTTRHQKEGWPVGDYGALVARLDSSIVVMADDIADRIRAVERHRSSDPKMTGDAEPGR